MKSLRKTKKVPPIAVTEEQLVRAQRAARVATRRRREVVTVTDIFRDGGLRLIDETLAAPEPVA